MHYTKTKIFNMTLKNLSVSVGIQNTNQTDKNTVVLNEFYESAKDQVLKDYDWDFASTYRELALTGNIPKNPKFLYEYDYPNDCLFAREIIPYVDNNDIIEFEIASNNIGQKVINTNQTPVVLRYTKCVDNETFFSTEFVIALSWYLSFLCALALNKGCDYKQRCFITYNNLLKKMDCAEKEGFLNKNKNGNNWYDNL